MIDSLVFKVCRKKDNSFVKAFAKARDAKSYCEKNRGFFWSRTLLSRVVLNFVFRIGRRMA